MQSPKKGLICNLNHVHLQHISLGLHLSRHPELQEDSNTSAPRQQTDCRECRGHGGGPPEQVDANSNNPLTPCRCCSSHPLRSDTKLGLQIQSILPNRPVAKNKEEEDDEEEAGSPSDAASSSVSSCSDLSLDDTPVSVYCKEFPTEEAPSPDSQPNIVPLEDARSALSLAGCDDGGSNLNIRLGEHPASRVRDSPDSLCSSSSLESPSASPCTESPVESPPSVVSSVPPIALPPVRPSRAPPAVPAPHIGTQLDSNCNALSAQPAKSENLSALPSGQLDVNLNRAVPPRPGYCTKVPPPIPPRTKRGLLGLKRCEVGKPAAAVAPSTLSESQLSHSDQPGENGRKNITSFHELAQKRKKITAVPPFPQTRKDQSDWLIIFSPDTELPPCNEFTCGSAPSQETSGPPISPEKTANPGSCGQREVTTFKELRYRKQKTQPAAKVDAHPSQHLDSAKGISNGNGPQETDWELPPNGHFWALKETQPRRKKSRPGLQPIVERGCEEGEEEGMEQKALRKDLEDMPPWRDIPGKAERGDRCHAEAGAFPACSSRPQNLPFHPLLFRFSVVDGKSAESLHPSLCPSLESVELTSPSPLGSPFCPRLKTLSCEEVCLLASKQGQVLGTLSPEELLPIRLSPIGAYSPPARSVLPFLESPDLAVLFSPLFPRSRTFPALAFPTRQVPKLPFGAHCSLDSQAGAGPGRVSRNSMGTRNPGHPEQLRHSQSFGGVPSTGRTWGAAADRVSVQLREQKKALLVAVSASVDRIVAHFSTARNLVQKAQLGDSRLSPDVGYLVMSTLCPALRALVCDGLKPFQKDVITGQRPSSSWSVVEASAKPGPHTRSLNALYWRVSRLAPLRSNQQRFHAFILGLLNMKQLEQWFSHLQRNTELISALYLPSAFLVLAQGFCRRWAEELLLLLQPLSTLTFQLDLLFEYHHLSLDVRPAPHQAAPATEPSSTSQKVHGSGCLHLAAIPILTEGPLAQSSPLHEPQAGVSLPQRLLQWGDRLTHTLRGSEASPKLESCPPTDYPGTEEKQRSWWERLNWASGGCATAATDSATKQESFPFTRWTKLRGALEEAVKEVRAGGATSSNMPSPTESSTERPRETPTSETESLPEAVAEWKLEMSRSGAGEAPFQGADEKSEAGDSPGKGQWLGWLFGATYPTVSGSPAGSDSSVPKSRLPSSWLPPSMNVLALVMKSAPLEKNWAEDSWEKGQPDPLRPHRAVRALCNHTGTAAGQLSFCKGDILQVLDTVNEDWIQCCRGDSRGLVPVGYTSLIL
ncbi:AP-4 complex accessory subunit RUSC1 isoform X2 [Eublepharis macularius]|uniref:AP-4 complex accessory subunit RUSC1 isoform X2 n=1 Tax=Eublepharis macularius TaxID=481883 RepID=A0AA97K3J9_EUBMA|nr:AP-4 complex accessory subunit RUSC1 isoform X2 [Eublepharis macularius]